MTEKTLAYHFDEYFSICLANTEDLKKQVFKLRYDVYCAELGYEKDCPIDCERDIFDEYSTHVLIKHKPSGLYAGCVRVVTPPSQNPNALLPFEANCSHSFNPQKVAFLRDAECVLVGEVSRLAVLSKFRLRAGDAKSPDGINPEKMSLEIEIEEGMRYFPFIAVSLYFAATSIVRQQHLKYAVVMMDTRLARLLKRSGISFIQLGEIIDYHGLRALYYIEPTFVDSLKPELKELYNSLDKQLIYLDNPYSAD
ncbi:MAG: PEP-CTERM/exosortase system-associated acyltransferase [Methylococcaceae bacterium]|nr:PEP-CTERM/exosortase system-associated acyltransferase [Methylococcaceae bacterium]